VTHLAARDHSPMQVKAPLAKADLSFSSLSAWSARSIVSADRPCRRRRHVPGHDHTMSPSARFAAADAMTGGDC